MNNENKIILSDTIPILEIDQNINQLNSDLISEEFLKWFNSLTEATRRNYIIDLYEFASYVNMAEPKDAVIYLCSMPNVKARHLVGDWRDHLKNDKKNAPTTINRKLSAVRSLYKRIVGMHLVVLGVKPRKRYNQDRVGSDLIVKNLLNKIKESTNDLKRFRNLSLVLMLHDSGLRRFEVASTRIRDLSLNDRHVSVVYKGGGGEREPVDLSIDTVNNLKEYLSQRSGKIPNESLLLNMDRASKDEDVKGLLPDGVHSVIVNESKLADPTHIVKPHDLRRFGAYALARAGADAETLRVWGRWSDYRTPSRYVGEVREKAKEAVDLLNRLRNQS